jgi:hypothetical protein
MDKETLDRGESDPIAPESPSARLRLDIEHYEGLLQTGLKPKPRMMFEHLLARVRAELAVIEAEEEAADPAWRVPGAR